MNLSDKEIYECLEPYLYDGKREWLAYLDETTVPEKYRIAPKKLYRGVQIPESNYKKGIHEVKPFISFTTSLGNAKDFARGNMGNDYHYRTLREKRLGVVYTYKPQLEDIIIAVGTFLRKSSLKIKHFVKENEYILKGKRFTYHICKDTVVWYTDKICY